MVLGARTWVCSILAIGCADIAGLGDFTDRSTGGAGGGAAGGLGSAGAGGADPFPEECTNGLDDDKDGATDCADSDCADLDCTASVPAGFQGPLFLVDGGALMPSCPDGVPIFQGGEGTLMAALAECADCTCDARGGCLATWELFDDGSCVDADQSGNVSPGCTPINVDDVGSIDASTRNGFGCDASGGEATVPPVTWAQNWVACLPAAGGGCEDAGASCVAAFPEPSLGPCVYAPGDVACDDPAYPGRRLLTVVGEDDRTCTPCECTLATPDCEGEISLHAQSDCVGIQLTTTALPVSACDGFTPVSALGIKYLPNFPGDCLPTGGAPVGGVVLEPMTVCCSP